MRANTGGRARNELHNVYCNRCGHRTHGTLLYPSQARHTRICPRCRGLEIIETLFFARLRRHRDSDAEDWWEAPTEAPARRHAVLEASLELHN